MPVIEVKLSDFLKLLGKDLSIEELSETMPMMGVSWEGSSEDSFSIEVFPNRPDMLSVEGLARSYASFMGFNTGLRNYKVLESDYTSIVAEEVRDVRPYFCSAVIKNIEFDDSLIRSIIQMQEKLHVTHGRKRRKVSIGLHDLKPIKFPVIYTTKPPEFKFRPLGERSEMTLSQILSDLPKGVEYAWILEGMARYPILMDSKGMVLSMPPIINSEHTRIDEATDSIFIDVTSTDWKAMNEVLNIIVTTFADRGAGIYQVSNKYPDKVVASPNLKPREMNLALDYVNDLLGVNLTHEQVSAYLERMGYGVQFEEALKVLIPSYRTDIMHQMDLVEDIAIAYGYDKFVPEIPPIASPAGEDPLEIFCRSLRNLLVGYGFLETVTFMMTNRVKLFKKMCLPEEPVAEAENSKNEEYNIVRNRLIPSLLEVLSLNKHHPYPQNIFEVAEVLILDPEEDTGAKTAKRLAVALCHAKSNFSEIKSVTISIIDNLGIRNINIEPSDITCFIEGRGMNVKVEGHLIGYAGELKPEVLENWEIEMPTTALELDADALYDILAKCRRRV
ncbi:phenylalanine--tRNA ligase subunit beta [Candidatus Bathyarchaeota archaeon]|nr:phenylalanine--tRNA ligase subunit beta [Candidatus Bathyarchaeota archaeon]